MHAQWIPSASTAPTLCFERCKGGYFSDIDEYGLRLIGNTKQKVFSGKNLYDYTEIGTTRNGVIFTPTDDGVIVHGTATEQAYPVLVDVKSKLKIGRSYFVSSNHNLLYPIIRVKHVDGSYTYSRQMTVTGSEVEISTYFYVKAGDSFDHFLAQVQLEEGTEATEFEPYCGGIPSPNPDYPQPIQCVKAGTVVRCRGKNLLKVKNFTGTINGLHVKSHATGRIRISGTANNPGGRNSWTGVLGAIHFRAGVTYTISGFQNAVGLVLCISDHTTHTYVVGCQNNHTLTFTPQIDFTGDVGFNANDTITQIHTEISIQVEEGNAATPYEPYVPPVEITTPCDLYEGDVWWPMSGRVERHNMAIEFNGSENWIVTTHKSGQRYAHVALKNSVSDSNRVCWSSNIFDSLPYPYANIGAGVYKIGFTSSRNELTITLPGEIFNTKEDFKAWLQNKYSHGTPFLFVYKLMHPTIEPYAPQPIFAPAGTVIVDQTPVELVGTLSATMLTRRSPEHGKYEEYVPDVRHTLGEGRLGIMILGGAG